MTHPAASAKNSQLKREERSDYRQICLTQTNPDIFSLPIFFLHPTPPKKSILPDLKRPTLLQLYTATNHLLTRKVIL